MKKIVITGALGYIGTELCKIYSGYSWKYEIIGIDNRFVSERVNQLINWKINFQEVDILDYNKISSLISDADIVHHLAGITDVAYVKKDSNKERDDKIKLIATQGTQNILDCMKSDAKIIFPSTHVVFEGLNEKVENIDEEFPTSTFLAYSSSKVENENQIKKSKKKYVILRLGSVYGFSTDTMRLGIMPNLFSKITSQNGTIKLFGGGDQIKSLVQIQDVARCFKFMEEKEDIKNETFNLSNENVSVSDVANICKKYNPKLNLVSTPDEVPNPGYTLSNKKLKKTGFSFLYSLEKSISDMIEKWSYIENNTPLEYTYNGKNDFIDKRGKISNYELTEPINLIGYIESKKGSIRANHYHPIQEQKCFLIKGQFISIYQDLLGKDEIKITHLINEGDMIVTKPNVAHTMIFTKDSILLNLVRGEREHKNYGITHTILYPIVDNNEKQLLEKFYKLNCRCCGSQNLKRVVSLGYQPLANNLIVNKTNKVQKYPLELNVCTDCFNCQLSVSVPAEKMFSKYLYQSSTSDQFVNHFRNAAKNYIKKFKLKKNDYIIDIGSNDGIGLKPFHDLNYKNILGIEPAKNLSKISKKRGIKTINSFLNYNALKKIKKNAKLVLASNVFAHADNLLEIADCMKKIVHNNGVIIIEVQYLLNTLKDCTFDNIYHEHYNYWSLGTINKFFEKINCKIFHVEKINTHGGSIRVYVSKNPKAKVSLSVKKMFKEEEKFGLKDLKTYLEYGSKIEQIKKNVIENLKKIQQKYSSIVAYGAPAKSTTYLNYIKKIDVIDHIVEDNKLKINKYIPGVNILIKKKNLNEKKKCILVLAWNFFEYIKKNNSQLTDKFYNIKDLEDKNFKA